MGMENRGVNGLEVPRFKIDILRAYDTFATAKKVKVYRSFSGTAQCSYDRLTSRHTIWISLSE
jgi:hypothetical protein